MRKALELAPNDCRIVSSVGAFLGIIGELEEAEKLFKFYNLEAASKS